MNQIWSNAFGAGRVNIHQLHIREHKSRLRAYACSGILKFTPQAASGTREFSL